MSLIPGAGRVPGRIVLVCGAITAGAGALILVGWAIGWDALTAMGTNYIPMAPNTALLFALLGSAVLVREVWPASRVIHRAAAAAALLSAVVAGVTLIGFAIGLNIDDWLFRTTRMLGAVPIGRMSPVTAFCFVLAGVSLLLLECQARTWAAILGTLITLVGAVCLMGYWFGAPLLYGGTVIPVALPTSLALVALGVGLIAAAGPDIWPLNTLIGPSTRARLLRALLPTVVLLALINSWITSILHEHSDPGVVLASAMTAISILLVVSYAVTRVSGAKGDSIDRTQAERKRAEETQAWLAAIVKSSNDAIIGRAIDSTITSWNAAAERIFGYAAAEVIGRDPVEIFLPEERQQIAALRNLVRTGQPVPSYEAVRIAKDGRRIDVTISISSIRNDSGNIIGTATIVRDITERKQAENALREGERRYRSLFDNMLEGFAYCRMLFENGRPLDFVYVGVNPAFEQLTGLKNVVGKKMTEIIPGIRESNPEVFERYGRVASTGKPETFETYLVPLKIWISVSAFCPEQGCFVAVFENITERKAVEQKVRDYADDLRTLSRKLLEVQEDERRLLARELHDEVGQTLTALKINLQVLGRQPAMAPVASTIEECVQIASQALAQVRILTLDLRPPQLDELGLAVALHAHAERRLTPASLILHFSEPDALPKMPSAVEIACFRIAQEALTNILRHAGARNVWIDLASDGGVLCLTVRDDGSGFDYSASRVRAARGGSIGLLGMEERAALAGGRIEISTAPGAGTTVRALFPLQAAQSTVDTA